MGATNGNYSRFMYDEPLRYVYALVTEGIPWVDADENDSRQSFYTQLRRIQQLMGCGAVGDGFKVVGTGATNSFTVTGGDGTPEGAGRFFFKGFGCILLSDVTWNNTGATEGDRSLFPRITHLSFAGGQTTLTDTAANWEVNEHAGKTITPDVTSPATYTIVSNTANALTITGDVTSSGADVGSHYRIEITTPTSDRYDYVYINAYIDEYDENDDPNLIHALEPPREAQLRAKLIQALYIREGADTLPETYTDLDGRTHFTYLIATIRRSSGVAEIYEGNIIDHRPIIADSLECGEAGFDWLAQKLLKSAENIVWNGYFERGRPGPYYYESYAFNRHWRFQGGSDTAGIGELFRMDSSGPEGGTAVRMRGSPFNSSTLYQDLVYDQKGLIRDHGFTLGVDIRILRERNAPWGSHTPPVGTGNYSAVVSLGDTDFFVNNADFGDGDWHRITVPMPTDDLLNHLRVNFEVAPGSTIDIARVAVVGGIWNELPPLQSLHLRVFCPYSYIHRELAPAATWTIVHGLNTYNIIPMVYNAANEWIIPDSFEIVDRNVMRVNFSAPVEGKCIILTGLYCGPTFAEDLVNGFEWTLEHDAETEHMFVGAWEGDLTYRNWVLPDNINIVDMSNIQFTFSPAFTGYVMALNHADYVHEQIALDSTWLINHGLGTEDLFIQCFNSTDDLIQTNVQIIDSNNVLVDVSPAASGRVHFLKADKSYTYTHLQSTAAATWTVNHNFNNADLLVCCYDASGNIILPDTVEWVDNDTTEITFSSALSGKAIIVSIDENVLGATAQVSGEWKLLEHDGGSKVATFAWEDTGTPLWTSATPDDVTLLDDDTALFEFSPPFDGRILAIADPEFVYYKTGFGAAWTVTHNLETEDILVQVYDEFGHKIIPDSIEIIDENTVQVVVTPPRLGFAVIFEHFTCETCAL